MVVCKAITGVMSSRKKGEKFSADKLRDTVFNFIAYGIAIIISFLIEQIVLGDFPALKTMTALICYVELKSINENIEEITGLNLFKGILSALNFKNKKV